MLLYSTLEIMLLSQTLGEIYSKKKIQRKPESQTNKFMYSKKLEHQIDNGKNL